MGSASLPPGLQTKKTKGHVKPGSMKNVRKSGCLEFAFRDCYTANYQGERNRPLASQSEYKLVWTKP